MNLELHVESERLVIRGIVTVNLELPVKGECLVIRGVVTLNIELPVESERLVICLRRHCKPRDLLKASVW